MTEPPKRLMAKPEDVIMKESFGPEYGKVIQYRLPVFGEIYKATYQPPYEEVLVKRFYIAVRQWKDPVQENYLLVIWTHLGAQLYS